MEGLIKKKEGRGAIVSPPLTYSKEIYNQVLALIEAQHEKVASFQTDEGHYQEDLQEDRRIYDHTKSATRRRKVEISERKVQKVQSSIEKAKSKVEEYKDKLKILYELAHEEALKEDDEYNKKRLEQKYQSVTAIEKKLERFDVENIPTAEEYTQLQATYDAEVGNLLDGVIDFFRKHPNS